MTTAFDPITVGRNQLSNRIVMSPMTRSRAYGAGATPTDLMASYYAQRASAGLIITEGTQPSQIGQGYPNTPGLHTPEQVQAWRPVADAVHRKGGVIFAQLMHTGRIGHPSLFDQPQTPVGASSVRARGQVFTPVGPQDFVTPEELSHEGVLATIDDFAHAATNAVDAGFDGVELHGANGYLLHQFLSTNANLRTDAWGGSPANRVRLTIAATRAVADAIGADRTALRISPANPLNDIVDEDWEETYPRIVAALNPLGLAYLHVLESGAAELTPRLREQWDGPFLLNPATPGSRTGPTHLSLIENGATDLLSFGALLLANPDLPARLATGGPFNNPDMTKAYGGDHNGYTDYPALDAA
jgi:N-ethylmaleimide reductase